MRHRVEAEREPVRLRLEDEHVTGGQAEEGDAADVTSLIAGATGHPGDEHRLGGPARDERGAVESKRHADGRKRAAHRGEQSPDLAADPAAQRENAEQRVRSRDCKDPRGRARAVPVVVEQEPAGRRGHSRVREQERRRRDAKLRRRHAQLVAERCDDVKRPERGRDRERQPEMPVALGRGPVAELRDADDVGDDGEPGPTAPDQHADCGAQGERHERQAGVARAGVDENRREQRADDADRRDDDRVPPHGNRSRGDADQRSQDEADRRRDEGVHGGRGRVARVQRGDRSGDRSNRRLGLALPLVQPEADDEQRGRAREREDDPRRLVDPAVAHRHDEEEHRCEEHGDTAHPAEDAAAEELLEVEGWPPGCRRTRCRLGWQRRPGGRPGRGRRRLRRERRPRHGRRGRRRAGFEQPLQLPHTLLEGLETSFHGICSSAIAHSVPAIFI